MGRVSRAASDGDPVTSGRCEFVKLGGLLRVSLGGLLGGLPGGFLGMRMEQGRYYYRR